MYTIKGDMVKISVRNLVEFICRSGDIESQGMRDSVKAMQEGSRIHKKIQKSMGALYHAEVPLKLMLTHADYRVCIEGRADGIICDMEEDEEGNRTPLTDVIIDEIKTTMRDVSRIEKPVPVHEAQAKCYAYIYAMQSGLDRISVQMTYANPETDEVKRLKTEYSIEEISVWFNSVIEELYRWTDFLFDERRMRQSSVTGLDFPYEYRDGQRNLVVSVYRSIEQEKNLYIQAPTGVGKTLSTVFPAVAAMGQEMVDKIFYLTSKTITRKVAEDTYGILREKGLHFRSVTLTAKDKLCPMPERKCNPKDCPYAKGHFDRVNEAIYDCISNSLVIDRQCIAEYAKKHCVCPFEMSLDVSYWCDGIICDYNYVFDPNVALKRYFGESTKGDYVFLVDEAHNLVERAREMYSARLIKEDFLHIEGLVKETDKRLASGIRRCNKELLAMKRECDTYKIISDCGMLTISLERVASGIQKFMEKYAEFEGREELLEFYFDIKHFLNMYDYYPDGYVMYTEHTEGGKFAIRLYCVDPSGPLSQKAALGRSTVFFSATLLPVNYYKEMLSGDVDEPAVYAKSSFPDEHRCILVGRDVSSRYTRRGVLEYRKICKYIHSTVMAHSGKYMVFFPSYSFMESVLDEFENMTECDRVVRCDPDILKEVLLEEKIHILPQSYGMKDDDKEWFLSIFDDCECRGSLVGFCVTGGAFSEGIDLKDDSLIGVIVVGTGLPMICRERDILKGYFDGCGKEGYEYAYVYPGMNKVQQAAGRVIRTKDDRGVIELLDDRFLNQTYKSLYPREWSDVTAVCMDDVAECVSRFWNGRI